MRLLRLLRGTDNDPGNVKYYDGVGRHIFCSISAKIFGLKVVFKIILWDGMIVGRVSSSNATWNLNP